MQVLRVLPAPSAVPARATRPNGRGAQAGLPALAMAAWVVAQSHRNPGHQGQRPLPAQGAQDIPARVLARTLVPVGARPQVGRAVLRHRGTDTPVLSCRVRPRAHAPAGGKTGAAPRTGPVLAPSARAAGVQPDTPAEALPTVVPADKQEAVLAGIRRTQDHLAASTAPTAACAVAARARVERGMARWPAGAPAGWPHAGFRRAVAQARLPELPTATASAHATFALRSVARAPDRARDWSRVS